MQEIIVDGLVVYGDRMGFVPVTVRTEKTSVNHKTLSLAFDSAEIMIEISCNNSAVKKILKEVSE